MVPPPCQTCRRCSAVPCRPTAHDPTSADPTIAPVAGPGQIVPEHGQTIQNSMPALQDRVFRIQNRTQTLQMQAPLCGQVISTCVHVESN